MNMTSLTGKDGSAIAQGSGIYAIYSPCGRVYVGQAVSIEKRLSSHKSSLRGGYHKNRFLQSAWCALNGEGFKFEPLENAPLSDLNARESHWMTHFNVFHPDHGFNISQAQSGTNGFPCEEIQVGAWVGYRRISDGYWNASGLCAQFGKNFTNWSRLESAQEFRSLLDVGPHGSWIHPDLVMLFTPWLSHRLYFAYMRHLRAFAESKGLNLDTGLSKMLPGVEFD
jgi:hypothetical protein